MSLAPLDFDYPGLIETITSLTLDFTVPNLMVIASGVALIAFTGGQSDGDWKRDDLIFSLPRADKSIYTLPGNVPPTDTYLSNAIAFPATVELDGSGILGWGVDNARAEVIYPPSPSPDQPPVGIINLYARIVAKNPVAVMLRVAYQVTVVI